MRKEQCEKLKKGDHIKISLGDGWYQECVFIRLTEVINFGKVTLEDIMTMDFTKGRKTTEALVECDGKTKTIGLRRIVEVL